MQVLKYPLLKRDQITAQGFLVKNRRGLEVIGNNVVNILYKDDIPFRKLIQIEKERTMSARP